MRSFNLFVLAAAVSAVPMMAMNTINIADAAKKGLVKLTIKSKGGHIGNVIEIKIQNLINEPISLKLEAGRRLDSKDNGQQDILVTMPQQLYVKANELKSFNVFGMCCQANNASPLKNALYSIGTLADSSLVKFANFIDRNKYYIDFTAQQAVWCISDKNSLAGITGNEAAVVNKCRDYVTLLTGRTMPSYTITYKRENDASALGQVNKIDGEFSYSISSAGKISMGIYNSAGRIVQLIFDGRPHEEGRYRIFYTFKAEHLPAGIYYTRMKMNGIVLKEEKIEF